MQLVTFLKLTSFQLFSLDNEANAVVLRIRQRSDAPHHQLKLNLVGGSRLKNIKLCIWKEGRYAMKLLPSKRQTHIRHQRSYKGGHDRN